MKTLLRSLAILFLLSGPMSHLRAGENQDIHLHVVTCQAPDIAPSGKPAIPTKQPHFAPAKQMQLAPRVDLSLKATLPGYIPSFKGTALCLPADPFINQHTQGFYLRYWPRDPPAA